MTSTGSAGSPVIKAGPQPLGPRLNRLVYPGWAAGQACAVEEVCRDQAMTVWVAEAGSRPVGFVAVAFRSDADSAEIEMIAVDPVQQNRGIGSALLGFAFDRINAAGVRLVQLGTGGDPGHAPARRTYEKAGFTQSRYDGRIGTELVGRRFSSFLSLYLSITFTVAG